MSTRILVADDHVVTVAGIRATLERQSDFEIVGEAGDGLEALTVARDKKPDVVIMDISMPGLNGIEASRRIATELPSCRVLILSMHSDKRFVAAALDAGASGYLVKESAARNLVEAVRSVTAGRTYLCAVVSETGVNTFGPTQLTPKEREVLQLIAESYATKEIAARLNVSVKTVSTHRQHIMDKLGIHDVAGLTRYAIRRGLTNSDVNR